MPSKKKGWLWHGLVTDSLKRLSISTRYTETLKIGFGRSILGFEPESKASGNGERGM